MPHSYLAVTQDALVKLLLCVDRHGWAYILARYSLLDVLRITAKRHHPNLITFVMRVPSAGAEPRQRKRTERFMIPDAFSCTRLVKRQIMTLRDASASASAAAARPR